MQPGFFPTSPFPFPISLEENGILSDVKKLLQNINNSFKDYAFPVCPVGVLLHLIPPIFFYGIFPFVTFEIMLPPVIWYGIFMLPYVGLFWFMHHKRRLGIKAAIKEFNQTLMDRRIWAQWISDYYANESDDEESHFDDWYTTNMYLYKYLIAVIRMQDTRRSRIDMQPWLLIKKREYTILRKLENYASMQNYSVPTEPQLPYQVV